MSQLLEPFLQALQDLNRVEAQNILRQAEDRQTPIELVEGLVVPALEEIGRGWEDGTITLSQVYMSGRICEELVDLILPQSAPERKKQPNMAIVVLEDYHLLGKRIVYSILRASGFELADYGRMTVEEIVARTQADELELLLVSVLMLPSALRVKDLRAKFDELGLKTKIITGGAPFIFDENLWQEVGATAMGQSASEAIEVITQIMEGKL